MNIQIQYLYPTAKPLVDYTLQDDGTGPYIVMWNDAKLGTRPTQAQIEAVSVAANTAHLANEESVAAQAKLNRLDMESIRLMREYLITRPNCPQRLQDIELEAVETRKKVKPKVEQL